MRVLEETVLEGINEVDLVLQGEELHRPDAARHEVHTPLVGETLQAHLGVHLCPDSGTDFHNPEWLFSVAFVVVRIVAFVVGACVGVSFDERIRGEFVGDYPLGFGGVAADVEVEFDGVFNGGGAGGGIFEFEGFEFGLHVING